MTNTGMLRLGQMCRSSWLRTACRLLVLAAVLRGAAAACKEARPQPPPPVAAPSDQPQPPSDLEAAPSLHVKRIFYLPPISSTCPPGQLQDIKGNCRDID